MTVTHRSLSVATEATFGSLSSSTGIVSLIPNQATTQEIQNDPSQVGYLLILPFTLLYLED